MKKKVAFLIVGIIIVVIMLLLYINDTLMDNRNEFFYNLYSYKNTSVEDAVKAEELVRFINLSSYDISSVEISKRDKTDRVNDRITVSFKTDDRSNHRYINDTALSKTALFVFSLVDDLDEINFLFFDDYTDINIKDTSYDGRYFNRELVWERENMKKFNSQYINGSTADEISFKEFYDDVFKLKLPKEKNKFVDSIHKIIGEDSEIVINSQILAKIPVTEEFSESKESKFLTEIFELDLFKYLEKEIILTTYEIRNYKTDEYKTLGLICIEEEEKPQIEKSAFLDEEQANVVKDEIAKRN